MKNRPEVRNIGRKQYRHIPIAISRYLRIEGDEHHWRATRGMCALELCVEQGGDGEGMEWGVEGEAPRHVRATCAPGCCRVVRAPPAARSCVPHSPLLPPPGARAPQPHVREPPSSRSGQGGDSEESKNTQQETYGVHHERNSYCHYWVGRRV